MARDRAKILRSTRLCRARTRLPDSCLVERLLTLVEYIAPHKRGVGLGSIPIVTMKEEGNVSRAQCSRSLSRLREIVGMWEEFRRSKMKGREAKCFNTVGYPYNKQKNKQCRYCKPSTGEGSYKTKFNDTFGEGRVRKADKLTWPSPHRKFHCAKNNTQ